MAPVIALILGIALGALAAALVAARRAQGARAREAGLAAGLRAAEEQVERERREAVRREREHEERMRLAAGTRQQLRDELKALSSDALKDASDGLVKLAREQREADAKRATSELDRRSEAIRSSIAPIAESLGKVERQIREVEKERRQAGGQVAEMMRSLGEGVQSLRSETGQLVAALRRPQTRGSWGEIQLRNVIEMAGMVEHCDFVAQPTVTTAEGRLRPDVLVSLPAGKHIVVDAKVPLDAYLESIEAADEDARAAALARHARQTRDHVTQLASKAYHSQFESAPEFVVMFVPSDGIHHAALQADPGLLQYAMRQQVLMTTPTTLIAVLLAAAYGWKQDTIEQSAREIGAAGRELHGRVGRFLELFSKVGRQLGSATNAYNEAVGSMEARVLPQLRRIEAADAGSGRELAAPAAIDTPPKLVTAPELGDAAEAPAESGPRPVPAPDPAPVPAPDPHPAAPPSPEAAPSSAPGPAPAADAIVARRTPARNGAAESRR